MRLKDILKILCSSLLLLSFTGCSSDDDPDMPPPADDVTTDGMVIYEANPALFGETQALNGLTAQLPRIKKLEANVLWLMPIFQQGEKNAVGSPYCVKDYQAINPAYGTLSDLKALVTKAHAEGMLVILDWVATIPPGIMPGLRNIRTGIRRTPTVILFLPREWVGTMWLI